MSPSRSAIATIQFVDDYCQLYLDLFPQVRSYEAFKYLHLGMISEIKRKWRCIIKGCCIGQYFGHILEGV